jgi:hypothetical protein
MAVTKKTVIQQNRVIQMSLDVKVRDIVFHLIENVIHTQTVRTILMKLIVPMIWKLKPLCIVLLQIELVLENIMRQFVWKYRDFVTIELIALMLPMRADFVMKIIAFSVTVRARVITYRLVRDIPVIVMMVWHSLKTVWPVLIRSLVSIGVLVVKSASNWNILINASVNRVIS